MASEIERRFLVKGFEWKAYSKKTINIKQGYISTDFKEWITRIRIVDEKHSEITLKAKETAMKEQHEKASMKYGEEKRKKYIYKKSMFDNAKYGLLA